MKIVTFIEKTKNGVIWKEKQKFTDAIFALKNGIYILTVEKSYNKRSSKQNAAKFGVIYAKMQEILSEEYGEYLPIYSNNDDIVSVHRLLLNKCAPANYKENELNNWKKNTIFDKKTGEILYESKFRLSSTNMTTVEEMQYIENIRRFAMEYFNVELPQFEK